MLNEAVYHAYYGDQIKSACRHSIDLGAYQEAMLLYRDKLNLQQAVADRINEQMIGEAVKEKDDTAAILLNDLGKAYSDLGEAQKAIEYYEKSLSIDQAIYGDSHPVVAMSYNNLGTAYSASGEAQKAVGYFKRALSIRQAVIGGTTRMCMWQRA